MALKLDGMSPKELGALIRDAQARMESARGSLITSLRAKIDGLLKAEGLQLSDVYPVRGGKSGKRPGAGIAKYRNPANAAQTWTGYGKKPGWFHDALKNPGTTEATLLIGKKTPSKPAAVTKKKTPAKGVVNKARK